MLLRIIPVIMGCNVESGDESSFIETTKVQNVRYLVKENAFSHLMEVGSVICLYENHLILLMNNEFASKIDLFACLATVFSLEKNIIFVF